ncbi:GATA-type zinc finger protein 1 isoform X2 [Scleropages formosus]|uniref:GATA-type domain-containing protein n=2 Tax=Scleropages formosus TaxID=113540 RepID=A0A8C9RMW6_SCLFO|nr:GATA-type zinc finger protein 1 isoform X2 [Scleropages formosus]XP_018617217.1 GATA-type zinc finger protein 1 isoform X2 [Scleropages formosus]XP_018617218.1 GATA-type zinc finger protein 1 isoform X2 [Scleropages formosus]
MSTDSENPATLRLKTTEDVEAQDDPVLQSTILYLLQEATKLATPAKKDPLEWKVADGMCSAEQNVPCSSGPALYTSPPSPPAVAHPYKHEEQGLDPCRNFSCSFSVLPSQQRNSPWEVMSLINLQCERLLHPTTEDVAEDGSRLVTTTSAPEGVLFQNEVSGHTGGFTASKEVNSSVQPQSPEIAMGKIEAWGSPLRKRKPWDDGLQSLLSDKTLVSNEPVQLEILTSKEERSLIKDKEAKQALGGAQLQNNKAGMCHLKDGPPLNTKELEGKAASCLVGAEHCLLEACGTSTESLSFPACNLQEDSWKQHANSAKPKELFSSVAVLSSVPLATVADGDGKIDCSSNVVLASDILQSVEGSQTLSHKLRGEFEPGSQEKLLAEGTCTPVHDFCNNKENNVCAQSPEVITAKLASDLKWRGRTPRKQRHPIRSADLCDPDFRGVSFRMHTELNNGHECRLLITSKYSAEFWKSGRRARGSRTRAIINSLKTSSSEEETDTVGLSKNKMCASCSTKTTPLWRDAEDGTPLCNACGIRYKKYRVRCHQCWYIPRKEGNSNSRCLRCGDALSLASSNS